MVKSALAEKNIRAPATLRIGLFSESFHPVQNGVTTSVLTLVAGLRTRRHRVWVFAPAHQQQRQPETNVLRFPSFVTAFNREYPLAYPFLPRLALAAHFHRLRLDIVHTHTPFVLGLTGANLALSRGVPLVTTYHTLYSQYSHYLPFLPDSVTQTLLEYYLPWYYNRCAEIICPSQVAANALRAQGVEQPITVIPTGIPLPPAESIGPAARAATRARLGLSMETPLLLYAGRLAQEKNIGWLLEGFARVHACLPEARLAIAGGGPHCEELQALAATLGLEGSALFLGPTPRREMNALYAAADVFCFPSPSETQGLVIGEARAAGTPCVVVAAGGAPETVRDGEDGFLVPPDNQEAFAARVIQIVQQPELQARLRANALRRAREFTPSRMVARVLQVYARAQQQTPQAPSERRETFAEALDWEAIGQSVCEHPS
ncbi:MAG TPA: glycosyltransferase [Chthonomonadaceae bacterium]|nr:glycosyltransferase [Chthonomonadaceae bacterium]